MACYIRHNGRQGNQKNVQENQRIMKKLKVNKEFVLEAHKAACSTWKEKIEKEFPKLFEEDFKEGDWVTVKIPNFYKWRDDTVRISRIDDYGYWSFNNMSYEKEEYTTNPKDVFRKATKEEIERHLIKEAEKRGLTDENLPFIECLSGFGFKNRIGKSKYVYELTHDKLWLCNGSEYDTCIYEKGKWAEKIETITKKEAEKQLGKKIV